MEEMVTKWIRHIKGVSFHDERVIIVGTASLYGWAPKLTQGDFFPKKLLTELSIFRKKYYNEFIESEFLQMFKRSVFGHEIYRQFEAGKYILSIKEDSISEALENLIEKGKSIPEVKVWKDRKERSNNAIICGELMLNRKLIEKNDDEILSFLFDLYGTVFNRTTSSEIRRNMHTPEKCPHRFMMQDAQAIVIEHFESEEVAIKYMNDYFREINDLIP